METLKDLIFVENAEGESHIPKEVLVTLFVFFGLSFLCTKTNHSFSIGVIFQSLFQEMIEWIDCTKYISVYDLFRIHEQS